MNQTHQKSFGLLAAALLLAAILPACHSVSVVNESVVSKHGGNDDAAQLDFWHDLAAQPVTCNDDAFHGLLLFLDDKDPATDYPSRVAQLKERNLIPQKFAYGPNEPVRRGVVAVAVVRILDIKGGLTMRMIGPNQRYATRELMYRNIYVTSSPNQAISGNDFLGLIGKIEDIQRYNELKNPAVKTPPPAVAAPAGGITAPPTPEPPPQR